MFRLIRHLQVLVRAKIAALHFYMPPVGCHLVKINLHAKILKLVKISFLLTHVRRRPVLVLFVDFVWLFVLVHCFTPVYLFVTL
jgi:hypothetical protein